MPAPTTTTSASTVVAIWSSGMGAGGISKDQGVSAVATAADWAGAGSSAKATAAPAALAATAAVAAAEPLTKARRVGWEVKPLLRFLDMA